MTIAALRVCTVSNCIAQITFFLLFIIYDVILKQNKLNVFCLFYVIIFHSKFNVDMYFSFYRVVTMSSDLIKAVKTTWECK